MSAIAPISKITPQSHGKQATHAKTASGHAGLFASLMERAIAQGETTPQAPQPVAGAAKTAKDGNQPASAQAASDPAPGAATHDAADPAGLETLAAALAGAQGLAAPATAAPATTAASGATLTARLKQHAAAVVQTAAPQAPAASAAQPPAAAKVWNVSDLAQHLKAALGDKLAGEVPTEPGAAEAAHPNLAASFATQQQGDKIRSAGMQHLMRAAQAAKTASATAPLTLHPVQPVTGAAALKSVAQQLTGAATPDLKAQADSLVAALATPEKPAAAQPETPPLAAAAAAAPAVEWAPEPVATDKPEATRMPNMVEQVRQAADFIADRTTGVIRMGDKGVEANMRLYPPDLGGVRVQMSVNSSGATEARFIVERPETAQLLQQHMRSFQQGLESRGLTVDRVQVTLQSAVQSASSTSPESGWNQHESAQDSRRQSALANQRDNPKRDRTGKEQPFTEG